MSSALTWYTEQLVPTDLSDDGVWGPNLLGALSLFDRALGGVVSKSMTAGDVTLDATEAQHGHIVATGTPGGANKLFIPPKSRTFKVRNALTSAQNIVVQIVGSVGTTVIVPYQCALTLYCDATNTFAVSSPVRQGGGAPDSISAMPGLFFHGDTGAGLLRNSVGVQLWGGGVAPHVQFDKANTVANPAIKFSLDGTTFDNGFFAPTNDALAWGNSGTEHIRFSTSGNLLVGRTATVDNTSGCTIWTTGQFLAERSSGVALVLNQYGGGFTAIAEFYSGMTHRAGSIAIASNSTVTYGQGSDAELKTEIMDAPDLWGILHAVPVRSYEFKDEPGRKVVGIVAQEAHEPWEVFQGAIAGSPERDFERDGPMMFDGGKVVPGLLWAAQNLDRRLRELEAGLA